MGNESESLQQIDTTKPVVLYIHGFESNAESEDSQMIKNGES